MPDRRRISKLLSLILRHRPDEFGLNMDAYGFIPLDEVVEAVQQRYSVVTEEDIRDLVETSRQRRFEITDQGIRALYAHSFYVEMDGAPMDPPESLYMATSAAAAAAMKEEGVRPDDRFYLHLSISREAAEARSGSIDAPALVEIRAAAAAAAGAEFWERGEVVLTRRIDADFVGEIIPIESAPPRPDDQEDDRPRRRPRRDDDREGGGRRREGNRREAGGGRGAGRPASVSGQATRRLDPKPEEMTYGRQLRFDAGRRR